MKRIFKDTFKLELLVEYEIFETKNKKHRCKCTLYDYKDNKCIAIGDHSDNKKEALQSAFFNASCNDN